MSNVQVDLVVLFLRMQAKEDRSIVSKVNGRPYSHGTQHSNGKQRWRRQAEFKIQDLMCRPHYAHLLRPTYLENLGRNRLLIPLGNAQHRQIKKHNRHRLCGWGRRNKEGVEQREIFPSVQGRVNPQSLIFTHANRHTHRQAHDHSNCHVQIIVSLFLHQIHLTKAKKKTRSDKEQEGKKACYFW